MKASPMGFEDAFAQLSAPKRKQESMNRCLVEVGVHFFAFTQKCLDLGERLGRFDKTRGPEGLRIDLRARMDRRGPQAQEVNRVPRYVRERRGVELTDVVFCGEPT